MLSSMLTRLGLHTPPTVRDRVRAGMHLHAVLGALPHLVRLDEEAAATARLMGKVAIEFRVFDGPKVVLSFADGALKVSRDACSNVGLFFPSCSALNRMFDGEKVNPIPFKNFLGHMKALQLLPKLTDRLTSFLKPSTEALADVAFRAKHVELSLLVGLAATQDLVESDPKVRRVAKELHDATMVYEIPGGPVAHVKISHGAIEVGAGPLKDPTTSITIKDVDLALGLVQGKVDTFAANGSGDIRASGNLHIADEYNNLFDRVGLYLK
jgi:hypothetical protein